MRMIVPFEKTERVRHLGHLDLMRFMQRALRRSGLPIRYSQGFNPHVLLSFASPLSVGMSGAEELMDVSLAEEMDEAVFAARLSEALSDSLPLSGPVRAVEDRHPKLMAQLCTAAYAAWAPADAAAQAMGAAVAPLLAREEVIAIRKTKSGEKPCDIRPMLHALSTAESDGQVHFAFCVSLTEKETLKPDLLMRTLAEQAGVEMPTVRFRRLRLYGVQAGEPVPLMEC